MSAKGKNFGVNVSATLDEARAAGDDGILYIPENEQEGVIVFGGKEYAAVSKGFRTYFTAKLNSEILNKYEVNSIYQCTTRTKGNVLKTNNTTKFEYGVGNNQNFGYDDDSKDFAQCISVTITTKYNGSLVDLDTLPTLKFNSAFVDEMYVTDGVAPPFFYTGTVNQIVMSKSDVGTYKAYFYFSDIVTIPNEFAPTNSSVLNYSTDNLKYVEPEYNIECSKKVNNVNIQVPAYFKPEFVINNSSSNHESICTTLAVNFYDTSIFDRKASVNGTYTLNSGKYLHLISTTNTVKIKVALGYIEDIVPTKVEVQLDGGMIGVYYVYTISSADTYTISK